MHGGKFKQSNGQILQVVAASNWVSLSLFGKLVGLQYPCAQTNLFPQLCFKKARIDPKQEKSMHGKKVCTEN